MSMIEEYLDLDGVATTRCCIVARCSSVKIKMILWACFLEARSSEFGWSDPRAKWRDLHWHCGAWPKTCLDDGNGV